MDKIEQQVMECLATIFPEVDPQELMHLDQATHATWDSVAHVTMIAALGEAFEFEFEFEAFAEATSFAQLVAEVKKQLAR